MLRPGEIENEDRGGGHGKVDACVHEATRQQGGQGARAPAANLIGLGGYS